LIVAKMKAGKSDGYIRQLRHCYTLFSMGSSRRPLASITVSEIEATSDFLQLTDSRAHPPLLPQKKWAKPTPCAFVSQTTGGG
jgi:hypothetical protein